MNPDRSIECVKKAFLNNKDPSRPDKEILQLLTICLKYNDFEFKITNFICKPTVFLWEKDLPPPWLTYKTNRL